MYAYTWYHWLTFFYFYCFFGWCFESAYVSIKEHRLVNRGFLHLPLLPLYGTGAVMMLWVSIPVRDSLILVYLSGVVAATALEYVTGTVMEWLFKVKYWDYSNQKFNLNGYICLSSSIAWGFLTILMTEVVHRPVERIVLNLNPTLECVCTGVITALFLTDTVQSVREALDLAQALEAATRLRGELDDLQVQLALLKAETTQHVQELLETQDAKVRALKESNERKLLELKNVQDTAMLTIREAYDEQMRIMKESYEEQIRAFKEASAEKIRRLDERSTEKTSLLHQHLSSRRSRILRRNPSASSRRFSAALKELKEAIDSRKAS